MLTCKNLILWRHADAEVIESEDELDINRELSPKGHVQAKKMAGWLKLNLPKDTLVLVSPALRAEQTAQALKWQYQVIKTLQPSALFTDVWLLLQEIETTNIVVVGHQPWLGQLVTYLTHQPEKKDNQLKMASIKKGAVWWFKNATGKSSLIDNPPSFKLVAVQHPDFV
jgi:phosphohistidine phosphatase